MGRHVRYMVITAVLIFVQTTLVRYLEVAKITPDLLAIWVTYLALKEGQLVGTTWGFLVGVGVDLVSGNFFGLSALTKTIGGFSAGYFHDERKFKYVFGSYRFLLVVFLSSLAQHVIYFVLFSRGTDIPILNAIVEFGVSTTLYTTLLSLFPVMIVARRTASINVE